MTTTTHTGPLPMPTEQAEAHLQQIEHLLADLEAAIRLTARASWPNGDDVMAARYLPTGTAAYISQWLQRCEAATQTICEPPDIYGWDT